MNTPRIEGQGPYHKVVQVDADHAPGEHKEKLQNLLTRTSRPLSGKERVKSLIKRANLISTGANKKIYSIFNTNVKT